VAVPVVASTAMKLNTAAVSPPRFTAAVAAGGIAANGRSVSRVGSAPGESLDASPLRESSFRSIAIVSYGTLGATLRHMVSTMLYLFNQEYVRLCGSS
jgi:hypothetical protein